MLPAVFVSHGSPMTALDRGPYSQALAAFGASERPTAIVVFSGHFEAGPPVVVTAAAQPPMIYDFYGFPPELHAVTYPAPGSPELAQQIATLLQSRGIPSALDPDRGFDHGAWVPLHLMYPDAQIPVVQVSLPEMRTPQMVFTMGKMLAPLREQGVLIMGSGGIVHNLRLPRPAEDAPAQEWAVEFDNWVAGKVEAHDSSSLFNYRKLGPNAKQAAPSSEHFEPLFAAMGAAGDYKVRPIYEGFQMGHMSLRTFALG